MLILWDLGTEFSTCGFSFESTSSTMQTCLKMVHCFYGGTFLKYCYDYFPVPPGLIVTTPLFAFGWLVVLFYADHAMECIHFSLTCTRDNSMITRIKLIIFVSSIAKVIQVSLAHQSDCLTAFLVHSKF